MDKGTNAREILARFDARYGHLRTGSIGYLAAVEDHGDYIEVKPLSLRGIEDSKPIPVDAALALSVGRALGMAGYIPQPDAAMRSDVLEVLQSGGHLALKFQAPGREPDGTERMMPPVQGCLVCDCGPGGCACY
jgi:hypothetical protein